MVTNKQIPKIEICSPEESPMKTAKPDPRLSFFERTPDRNLMITPSQKDELTSTIR